MWLVRLLTVICLVVGEGYARTQPTRLPTTQPTLIPTEPQDLSIIPQGGCLHALVHAPVIQSERRYLVSTKRGQNRRSLLRKFGNTLDSPNSTVIASTGDETGDSGRDLPVAVVNSTAAQQVRYTTIQNRSIVPLLCKGNGLCTL